MTDKETEHEKEGADLEEQDCPLSPTAWIMFLSGEIYNEENTNNQDSPIPTASLLAAITLSIISLILVGTTNPDNTINTIRSALSFFLSILIILIFVYVGVLLYTFLYRLPHLFLKTQKRVEALKKLRREIIFGKNDSKKIREEWEEIDKTFYPKKRRKSIIKKSER